MTTKNTLIKGAEILAAGFGGLLLLTSAIAVVAINMSGPTTATRQSTPTRTVRTTAPVAPVSSVTDYSGTTLDQGLIDRTRKFNGFVDAETMAFARSSATGQLDTSTGIASFVTRHSNGVLGDSFNKFTCSPDGSVKWIAWANYGENANQPFDSDSNGMTCKAEVTGNQLRITTSEISTGQIYDIATLTANS